MRKRCKFHKTHGIRETSSGLRFDELCTLRGKCSPSNCIYTVDAGGKENDQSADNKET